MEREITHRASLAGRQDQVLDYKTAKPLFKPAIVGRQCNGLSDAIERSTFG
jgi:hypothetical protein